MWDIEAIESLMGEDTLAHRTPYDPTEPERGFFWAANKEEITQYWMLYVSRFLKVDHFLDDTQRGTEILMNFVRGAGGAGLHLNKAQYGASEWAVKELEKTPMHPRFYEASPDNYIGLFSLKLASPLRTKLSF